uniref:Uncharacterized protein n=1 Tax=Mycena chlorophos TaxID=658473 RepID=A0ABQ0LAK5_MYCCL|nr:predicted protein [Mycena chlorophos]
MDVTFSYPVTRPFDKRWGYGMLGFGVLSMCGFIVLNVFLTGYDVIAITSTDFNTSSTHKGFWISDDDTTFGCQPHQFQLGDSFRTNISAFSYSIFDVQSSSAFSYAENDLGACDVSQYEVVITPGDRLVSASATVQCPPPLGFQAVTSWSFSNHDLLGTISPLGFPENSLARAITAGMNNISGEEYVEIFNKLYQTNIINNAVTDETQEVYKVTVTGQPNCETSPPFACTIPPFTSYIAVGNTDLNILPSVTSVAANVSNLYNVATVFFYAVRLDLGHWTADNVFTNTSAFNASIAPASLTTTPPVENVAFREIAGTKGMAYVNDTNPPSADTPTSAAVIQIPYTCNVPRRKPAGSFAVSVISASLSMFLGAWGALGVVLAAFMRRRPGANAQYKYRPCRLEKPTNNSDMPFNNNNPNKLEKRTGPGTTDLNNNYGTTGGPGMTNDPMYASGGPGAGMGAGMGGQPGMMGGQNMNDPAYGAGTGGPGMGAGGQQIPPAHAVNASGGGGGSAMTGKIEHAVGSIVGSKSLKAKGIQKEQEARALKVQSGELAEAERLENEARMRRERAVAHGAHPDHGQLGGGAPGGTTTGTGQGTYYD